VLYTDITNEESVAELRATITNLLQEHPTKKLIGVVNNAGIALGAPIEVQPYAQFKRQVEVNLFGHVLIAQQTIPFLRDSGGRLVNIVSIAGR
jgi:NAD(P)-dependent dehydrogenase (short-subunit alcohol dehydrogenase family)